MASVHSLATTASTSSTSDIPLRSRRNSTSSENLNSSICKTNGYKNSLNIYDGPIKTQSNLPASKSTPTTPTSRRIPRLIKSSITDDKSSVVERVKSFESNGDGKRLSNSSLRSPTTNGLTNGNTNGKYISNILDMGNGGVGVDQQKIDDNNLNGLMRSQAKSVKLLNNLNVFKSNNFAMPVETKDEF